MDAAYFAFISQSYKLWIFFSIVMTRTSMWLSKCQIDRNPKMIFAPLSVPKTEQPLYDDHNFSLGWLTVAVLTCSRSTLQHERCVNVRRVTAHSRGKSKPNLHKAHSLFEALVVLLFFVVARAFCVSTMRRLTALVNWDDTNRDGRKLW